MSDLTTELIALARKWTHESRFDAGIKVDIRPYIEELLGVIAIYGDIDVIEAQCRACGGLGTDCPDPQHEEKLHG